ncbi:MAG: hypothetical protein QM630_02295 [Microbacterium sp.]
MTLHRNAPRGVAAIAAVVLTGMFAASTLSGCAPTPEPTPTPTAAFASEEEAFAAAEEVYREYIDALNAIDPADPASFEPVFDLSSGSFETADRENLSLMHAEEHRIEGAAKVVSFRGEGASVLFDEVTAVVCLDVHEVQITDSSGNSLISPNRPDVYAILVTFVHSHRKLTINKAERVEDPECTSS